MTKHIDLEVSKKVYINIPFEIPDNWSIDEIQSGRFNEEIGNALRLINPEWITANARDIKVESISDYPDSRKHECFSLVK